MPECPAKPNVLIITTHDSGRHFGCYGVPTVRTPNIDRLAAEGVRFSNMYAACPICSPSRGALLSGQYPQTNGLVGLAGGSWNWELHNARVHLSHRLRDAGYSTAMFGLQHDTKMIARLGFDEIGSHGVNRDGNQLSATTVTDAFTAYLDSREGDTPFYAQIGFHETHTPYTFADCPPDEEQGVWMPPYARCHDWPAWASVLSRFGGDPDFARRHLAELQGSLREVDNAVGRILAALHAHGLAQHTLVLFNTDHGPELPGAKWTMYDAGLGIAFILRWPAGGVQGGRINEWLLGNIDFLPTLYELTGLARPDDLEGISFADGCRGDTGGTPSPRTVTFGSWVDGLNFSARTDRLKLIRNLVPVDSTGRHCPPHELYDLKRDPLELTNVANEPAYATDCAVMKAHLDRHLAAVRDPSASETTTGADHNAMLADYRARYEASRHP